MKLCSRPLMFCGRNFWENDKFGHLNPIFEGWKTHGLGWWLVIKPTANFQFASTELFRYLLRFRSYEAKCVQLVCHFWRDFPFTLNLSGVQNAGTFNFRRPLTSRHLNSGVHSQWLFLYNRPYIRRLCNIMFKFTDDSETRRPIGIGYCRPNVL